MEEKKEMNLYQKLNKIQTKSKEILKSGKGQFGSYKKFGDIARVVLGDMADLGIVFAPVNNQLSTQDMDLQTGDKSIRYIQEFAIINADKPEERITFYFPFVASNPKGVDWASGSAITYAMKYMFNLVFLIPDESLDLDEQVRDENAPKTTNKGSNQAIKKPSEQLNVKPLIEAYNDDSLKNKMIVDMADKLFMTANDKKVAVMDVETLKHFTTEVVKESLKHLEKLQGENK